MPAIDRRRLLSALALPLALRPALNGFDSNASANTLEREAFMSEPTQRIIESNGIRLNVAEQGSGPLVLLCHGFPESWYSWRHQMKALAEAGFHAVAPDMRGYGNNDRPAEIERYTLFHLVGDMVAILDSLREQTAVIVGHD